MNKKIMTGNYDNCKTGNLLSVSGDRGKVALYEGECKPSLAPKRGFWNIWHDNIGKISEEENIKYYVENYYKKVLSNYDPLQLYNLLKNETILLCYEENNDFCHRHLIAFYLELFLGIKTSEVKVNSRRQTYHVLPRPEYLKSVLEDTIRSSYDMHGFKSIRAAYLYNTYLKLLQNKKEEIYDEEMNTGNNIFFDYETIIKYRKEASEEEKKYILSMKEKSID